MFSEFLHHVPIDFCELHNFRKTFYPYIYSQFLQYLRLPGPGSRVTSHRHIMTTRTKYEHFLISSSTSVLKDEFIIKYQNDDSLDLTSSLPFSGALQLPTKMQALKLFLFIKDEVGCKNGWSSSKGEIEGMVTRVITHYWMMAGYPTVDQTPAQKQVKAIVDQYQTLLKSKSKNQPKAIKLRESLPRRSQDLSPHRKTGIERASHDRQSQGQPWSRH